jgi:hypothetical protein
MQHVTRRTIPSSMLDIYTRECTPIPRLDLLDSYRQDGKKCVKDYSDPTFFIDQWYIHTYIHTHSP